MKALVIAASFASALLIPGCAGPGNDVDPNPLLLSPTSFPPTWRHVAPDDQAWQVLLAWGLASNPGEIDLARFYATGAIPSNGLAIALTNGSATLFETLLTFESSSEVDAFLQESDRCSDGTILANEASVIRLAVLAPDDQSAGEVQNFALGLLLSLAKFRSPCP